MRKQRVEKGYELLSINFSEYKINSGVKRDYSVFIWLANKDSFLTSNTKVEEFNEKQLASTLSVGISWY